MKVLELKTFQFRYKKQKCKPDSLFNSLFAKSVGTDALEKIVYLSNVAL